MNNIETFAVIGGDLRSAYLAGQLAVDGYKVITSGFDSTDLPPCVTGCTNPAQAVSLADCVILPLPVTTDGSTINAPFSRVRITLDQVLNALHPDQRDPHPGKGSGSRWIRCSTPYTRTSFWWADRFRS